MVFVMNRTRFYRMKLVFYFKIQSFKYTKNISIALDVGNQ